MCPRVRPCSKEQALSFRWNLGWVFLLTTASPFPWHFDEGVPGHHRFLLPLRRRGRHACLRADSWDDVPFGSPGSASRVRTLSPGHFAFQSASPCHVCLLGIRSWGCQRTARRGYADTGEKGEGRAWAVPLGSSHDFLWFLVPAFPCLAVPPRLRCPVLPPICSQWE